MAGNSTKVAYNGVNPRKPNHCFSNSVPGPHSASSNSYTNQLSRFLNEPASVPLADIQNRNPSEIQAAHRARVMTEVNSILSRLK
ncbi:hypothetical protein F4805DRAFT_460039 [Annulohypoxylon moriforme]|nr:hypothetical protein F4805DRAFT_460039 [Annulohypoxylon moriforme]